MKKIFLVSIITVFIYGLYGCAGSSKKNATGTDVVETPDSSPRHDIADLIDSDDETERDGVEDGQQSFEITDVSHDREKEKYQIPTLDPHLFDCSSNGAIPQKRLSPIPLSCYTDPDCHKRMVVGHRAAGGRFSVVAPENTLAAVRAALWMGLDGIEIDVRDTKDGHLILMHDATVDRTTDGTGEVSKLTLEQIEKLHIKVPEKLKGDFSCERVPTFKQVLELAKERLFIDVDVKTDRVDLVVKAIKEAGMQKYATFSTGSVSKAQKARQLCPECSIQVRPHSMNELNKDIELFDPDPQVIEVPRNLVKQAAPVVKKLGLKLYTDMFGEDAVLLLNGNPDLYLKGFEDGADIEATEFPTVVLDRLGRLGGAQ